MKDELLEKANRMNLRTVYMRVKIPLMEALEEDWMHNSTSIETTIENEYGVRHLTPKWRIIAAHANAEYLTMMLKVKLHRYVFIGEDYKDDKLDTKSDEPKPDLGTWY